MRRPCVVLAVLAVLTGCGSPAEPAAETPRRSGRTFAVDTWYAASPGPSPDAVVLTFDGPDGAPGTECAPEREVVIDERDGAWVATIRRYMPPAVTTCPIATTQIEARLPASLMSLVDRSLVSEGLGWRFTIDDASVRLDPESTPCARADCSTPAPVAASCDPVMFDGIVSEQLADRTTAAEVRHCDGSFLVVSKGKLGWFVNRQAAWQLVTAEDDSCDEVHRRTRIRFPTAAC